MDGTLGLMMPLDMLLFTALEGEIHLIQLALGRRGQRPVGGIAHVQAFKGNVHVDIELCRLVEVMPNELRAAYLIPDRFCDAERPLQSETARASVSCVSAVMALLIALTWRWTMPILRNTASACS